MYLPHPYELLSSENVQRYLVDARSGFEEFYGLATAEDAVLMDRLMLTRAVLLVGMRANRDRMGAGRVRFERALDDTEQEFMQLQLLVRTCPTFAALGMVRQRSIECQIFEFGFAS